MYVYVHVCVRECPLRESVDISSLWDLGGGRAPPFLLLLKQMHLQLALSEEREGGQTRGRRGNMFRERRVNGA